MADPSPAMFTDADHTGRLISGLAKLQENGHFCDVSFLVEKQTFSAHKCVLVASSDYFAAMFAGGFKEDELKQVPLENVSALAFSHVLRYVYSGSISLCSKSVRNLFETADLLQFITLKKMCLEFIVKDIKPESCLDYLAMADIHSLREIKHMCLECINENFDVVSKMVKFKELSYATLNDMLSSDRLCIRSEMTIVDCLCTWLEGHPSLSVEEKDKLVENIRYGLLTGEDIQQLQNYHTVLGSETCQKLKDKLLTFLMNLKEQPLRAKTFRRPRGSLCLVVVGGSVKAKGKAHSDAIDTMDVIRVDSLRTGPVDIFQRGLPGPRTQVAMVTTGNYLFLIGGKSNQASQDEGNRKSQQRIESSVFRYDVLHNCWVQMCSMKTGRCFHAAVVVGGSILVVGGRDKDDNTISSVERYTIEKDRWDTRNDLPKPVAYLAACEMHGRMYTSGGCTSEGRAADAIYMYDDTGDVFLLRKRLLNARYGHGMCHDESRIYIIAGENEKDVFATVEAFDPRTCQSTRLPQMPWYLSRTVAVYHENCIYVAGGYGGAKDKINAPSSAVLVYETEADRWSEVTGVLPHAVCNCSCALLVFPRLTAQAFSEDF